MTIYFNLIFFDEGLSFSLNAFFMVANFRLYPRPVGPLSRANPGIFELGGPNVGSERTVELFFMANYFSQRRPRVS